MYKYEEIKSVHIELTERCQAACPMCSREKNPYLTDAELTLIDIKSIFEINFIKQLEHINFCGNFGDPIIAKDFLEILKYFKLNNSNITFSIHTNAGARTTDWWTDLAKTIGPGSEVYFSVDGLEDTNHIYRRNVNWKIVENSMRSFISANGGGYAIWDFLVFDHNRHQIEEIKFFAKELGFEKVRIKQTQRNKNFNPFNTNIIYEPDDISCIALKRKQIYISAKGLLFPCCWLSGDFLHPISKFYKKYIRNLIGSEDFINIKKYGIKEILEKSYFDDLKNGWDDPLQCIPTCKKKCGKKYFTNDYELM